MAIAFPMDNPGAWLLHCHIAWHIGEGLGVQLLESRDKIALPGRDWDGTCQKWEKYSRHAVWEKSDSGLKA